jgi:hypothetical protein
MCFSLTWTDGADAELHSYYFPNWTYEEEDGTFDNSSRGLRYWVYSNTGNTEYSPTGDLIQLKDDTSAPGKEVHVWATDSKEVGDGTYLVYVEDIDVRDVQNFELVLTGPGITDNKTYGPFNFKNDDNASTTEAVNPQAVFFIQVQNNSIVLSDNISIGDNLSSTKLQWTGPLQNSVF